MAIKACLPLVRVVAHKPLHLFPGVVVVARLSPIEEKRHGAPAVWLNAKRTYPICPILRRRSLAPLSFSKNKMAVLLAVKRKRGYKTFYGHAQLFISPKCEDSPHQSCLQPFPYVLVNAIVDIAALVVELPHGQARYVAAEMLQDYFHSVRVAFARRHNDGIGNKGDFRVVGLFTILPIHQRVPPNISLTVQKSLSVCTVSCCATY